jgi:hypothetical protein
MWPPPPPPRKAKLAVGLAIASTKASAEVALKTFILVMIGSIPRDGR